jgi:DNA-binding transcriptional regulator GbsR (MarR family)
MSAKVKSRSEVSKAMKKIAPAMFAELKKRFAAIGDFSKEARKKFDHDCHELFDKAAPTSIMREIDKIMGELNELKATETSVVERK